MATSPTPPPPPPTWRPALAHVPDDGRVPPASRPAPRSCSSRASSAGRRISAIGQEAVAAGCRGGHAVATTGRSAPTAATTTRSPAARRWPILRRAVRPRRTGLLGGKGGSMHLTARRARRDGQLRDRRRPPADRARGRLVRPVPRHRAGRRVLLRRRDDQHRRVPRGAQPGRRVEGAGRVRVREQPVHGVHADRRRDRGRAAGGRPGERLRPGADRGRRQRRGRGVRGRDDGASPARGPARDRR